MWLPGIALSLATHHSVTWGLISDLTTHISSQKKIYAGTNPPSVEKSSFRKRRTILVQESSTLSGTDDFGIETQKVDLVDVGRQFFPPVQLPKASFRPERLRSFMMIQYAVIGSAALFLGMLCICAIIFVYDSMEHSRSDLVEPTLFLAAAYVAVLGGAIVFAATAIREVEQSSSALILRTLKPDDGPRERTSRRPPFSLDRTSMRLNALTKCVSQGSTPADELDGNVLSIKLEKTEAERNFEDEGASSLVEANASDAGDVGSQAGVKLEVQHASCEHQSARDPPDSSEEASDELESGLYSPVRSRNYYSSKSIWGIAVSNFALTGCPTS